MAEELYRKQQEQREDETRGERADVDRYEYEQGKEAEAREVGAEAPAATGGTEDFDTSGQGSHDASGRGNQTAGTDVIPDGVAQANMASVAAKALAYNPATVYIPQVGAEEVEEHLSAMFDGQELSEEFKSKAGTIYEAAVNSKINELANELEETYKNVLNEQVETVVVNLAEKLDDYLNYVIDDWMSKNELAIERGVKTDVAESFITGLKSLFEAHYVDIPDERYDVLDDLFDANEKLQESLNEEIETNIELKAHLNEGAKVQIFNHYAQDLADTEIEKFASLSESVSYDDPESYNEKLYQIKEAYFGNNAPTHIPAELIEETTNPKLSNGVAMDGYVDTLAFHMRNK